MGSTNIEWSDATWNPIIGCKKIAAGCKSCYAETMSRRLAAMGQKDYASILDAKGKFNGKAITRSETLAEPLHWKKPRMVFVNSMSDLFHEDVPFEFIAAVFGVMAACPQHRFQVLTKRPERALAFFEWAGPDNAARVAEAMLKLDEELRASPRGRGDWNLFAGAKNLKMRGTLSTWPLWPLANVWLGVSIATQADADKNIPILLKCPAAVRFVSAEPLIGPVDLHDVGDNPLATIGCEPGEHGEGVQFPVKPDLDWVIVGGESGPGARPCDVAWIRSIVQQCKAAAVPVFVKQLGSNSAEQFGGSGALRPRLKAQNRKGGDPSEWPEDLRVREFPKTEASHA